MEAAKLKKQSTAYKTHLKISLNKLSEELAKEEKNKSVQLVCQYLQQVDAKYQRWEKAMMEIQECDEECDIEKSLEDVNVMLDLVIQVKVQADEYIMKRNKQDTVKIDHEHSPAEPPQHLAKERMNLPKLEMRKFSGENIEYYQEWYQIFIATIDRSSLSTVEKFIYLKMALEKDSEAEKLVKGYPMTADNYPHALRDLNDAYGDPQVVINHHVSKLLNLPKQSSPQSLRELYNSITTHVRSLDALGITSEMYSVFLVPIVKSKLSEGLRKDVTKKKITEIEELLKELKVEVETECSAHQVKVAFEHETMPHEDVKPQNKSYRPNSSMPYSSMPYLQPATSSAQALTTSSRSKYCIFCPGTQSHYVEECNKAKFMSPQQVREITMKENACLGCFKKGHRIFECMSRAKLKCDKCQSTRHHTYLHEEGRNGAYVTITSNSPVESPNNTSNQNSPVENPNNQKDDVTDGSPEPKEAEDIVVKGATALQARLGRESTIMPVIRVRMKGRNGRKLELNAMFDHCSDQTMVRTDVSTALA